MKLFATAVAFLVSLFSFFVLANLSYSQNSPVQKTLRAQSARPFRNVCDVPGNGNAHCHAKVITENDNFTPFAGSSPSASSMGPLQFHIAYQLPCEPGGAVSGACTTPVAYGPQTIAIVDAYHYPTVENDLTTYSNQFGIPTCTKASGCLQVLNQNGGTSLPTTVNAGWALEAALDVETAHAICQTCKIILFEANSSSYTDLVTAVNSAASMGVTAISNSYGSSEWNGESGFDAFYNHPGIAVTVSSGDSGYGAQYPAANPNVVAVGGTTLQLFSDNSYSKETVWSSGGSGCSAYESVLSFQSLLPNWNATGCSLKRGIADVSADADPNTGAAVYTSTPYSGQTGWFQVGGTSLSAPLIAGVYALTGSVSGNAPQILYNNYSLTNFHDILSGTNGSCLTIMCKAGIGYDGPTGLGSPFGLGGFGGIVASPTPTLTPTDTPMPTPTVSVTPTDTPTPTQVPTDNQPPTVAITSPLNGMTVFRNNTYTIRANASDNVKVTKVEFYVNNVLLSTDTTSSYTASWRVPNIKNVVYTLSAVAYDAAGNNATSSITVTAR